MGLVVGDHCNHGGFRTSACRGRHRKEWKGWQFALLKAYAVFCLAVVGRCQRNHLGGVNGGTPTKRQDSIALCLLQHRNPVVDHALGGIRQHAVVNLMGHTVFGEPCEGGVECAELNQRLVGHDQYFGDAKLANGPTEILD